MFPSYLFKLIEFNLKMMSFTRTSFSERCRLQH